MPNHVHGILILTPPLTSGEPALGARRHGIPELVRALKTFSARSINELRGTPGKVVWQRNYYEHIVRDERALERIREYILDNPRRWGLDRENAQRTGRDEFDRWIDSFSRPARRSEMTLES
jgi:REP element-mobilizing transposase RayT